jgi:hypothetical protein
VSSRPESDSERSRWDGAERNPPFLTHETARVERTLLSPAFDVDLALSSVRQKNQIERRNNRGRAALQRRVSRPEINRASAAVSTSPLSFRPEPDRVERTLLSAAFDIDPQPQESQQPRLPHPCALCKGGYPECMQRRNQPAASVALTLRKPRWVRQNQSNWPRGQRRNPAGRFESEGLDRDIYFEVKEVSCKVATQRPNCPAPAMAR